VIRLVAFAYLCWGGWLTYTSNAGLEGLVR